MKYTSFWVVHGKKCKICSLNQHNAAIAFFWHNRKRTEWQIRAAGLPVTRNEPFFPVHGWGVHSNILLVDVILIHG
jgi:hypothetical protein